MRVTYSDQVVLDSIDGRGWENAFTDLITAFVLTAADGGYELDWSTLDVRAVKGYGNAAGATGLVSWMELRMSVEAA